MNELGVEIFNEQDEYGDWRDWFLQEKDKVKKTISINYELLYDNKSIYSIRDYEFDVLDIFKCIKFTSKICIKIITKKVFINSIVIEIPSLEYKNCNNFSLISLSEGTELHFEHIIHL